MRIEGNEEEGHQGTSEAISEKHKKLILTALNEGFNRRYNDKDVLEVMKNRRLRIRSEEDRLYEWRAVVPLRGEAAVYVVERDGNVNISESRMFLDELVFEVSSMAVWQPFELSRGRHCVKCIIDTPGGVLKYPLPLVALGESIAEFIEIISVMTKCN